MSAREEWESKVKSVKSNPGQHGREVRRRACNVSITSASAREDFGVWAHLRMGLRVFSIAATWSPNPVHEVSALIAHDIAESGPTPTCEDDRTPTALNRSQWSMKSPPDRIPPPSPILVLRRYAPVYSVHSCNNLSESYCLPTRLDEL